MHNKIMQFFLFFIFINTFVFGVEGKIKVFIPNSESIYTSQKVTVAVEVLSSAFSITDVQITFPASDTYIIQAPKSAAYLGNEEVEDETWQMVHYDYDVYALKAGKVLIPSVIVSFTASMGYGQPKKAFELKSESLSFEVKSPKGIKENQFVLVTEEFSLESVIKPEKQKLIVGDAIELSVIQSASGVPDILLSPVHYTSSAFMRVYTKEPELKNGLQGKFDVSRIDRFTFVASVEGNVTIPAQERMWYNLKTEKVHVEKIAPMQFEILPDPQIAIDAQKEKQQKIMLYVGIGLLLLVVLYLLLASKIKAYKVQKKNTYEASEEGKFEHLLSTVQSKTLRIVDKEYRDWIAVASPKLSRSGIRGIETLQPSFAEALNTLNLAIVNENGHFDRSIFRKELMAFREILLSKKVEKKMGLPESINPS